MVCGVVVVTQWRGENVTDKMWRGDDRLHSAAFGLCWIVGLSSILWNDLNSMTRTPARTETIF